MAVSRDNLGRGLLFEKHTCFRCPFSFQNIKRPPETNPPLVSSYTRGPLGHHPQFPLRFFQDALAENLTLGAGGMTQRLRAHSDLP